MAGGIKWVAQEMTFGAINIKNFLTENNFIKKNIIIIFYFHQILFV